MDIDIHWFCCQCSPLSGVTLILCDKQLHLKSDQMSYMTITKSIIGLHRLIPRSIMNDGSCCSSLSSLQTRNFTVDLHRKHGRDLTWSTVYVKIKAGMASVMVSAYRSRYIDFWPTCVKVCWAQHTLQITVHVHYWTPGISGYLFIIRFWLFAGMNFI